MCVPGPFAGRSRDRTGKDTPMRPPVLGMALLAALPLILPPPVLAQPHAGVARTMWTARAGATVYAAASAPTAVLTYMPGNQPLRVVPLDGGWARTTLWNA